MKVRHPVSDAQLQLALCNNDYRRVIWSVLKRYAGQFSQQDLEYAFPLILYRTLGSHEDGRGQKFTTSLVKFAHWYMRNELDGQRARRGRFERAVAARGVPDQAESPDHWLVIQDELNGILRDVPDGYREVLMDYYLGEHTLDSLAAKYGCSKDFVARRLGNALRIAQEMAKFRYDEVEAEEEGSTEDDSW